MDMEFVRADATVTITLDVGMALGIMAGIRRMDTAWVASLSEEGANRKVDPDIHATRILPNHIARALQDLRGTLDAAKVKL